MPMTIATMVASTPISSDVRPPSSTRANRSRPRSSVPKMCPPAKAGGIEMLSKSDWLGSNGSTNGPKAQASTIRASTTRPTMAILFRRMRPKPSLSLERPATVAPWSDSWMSSNAASLIAHLRVDQRIHQVDDQIGDDDEHAIENDGPHHQRIVAVRCRLDEIAADAGDREGALDDDGAGDDAGGRGAEIRQGRQQAAQERVPRHRPPDAEALGPRRAHMIGAQRFDHAAAGQPRDGGDVRDRERQHRQHLMLPAAVPAGDR